MDKARVAVVTIKDISTFIACLCWSDQSLALGWLDYE